MENKAKPRICDVLGVDVGESFKVDFPSVTGVFSVDSDGTLRHKDNVKCCEVLSYMINHPECIQKLRRWTPEEVEFARAIKVVWPEGKEIFYPDGVNYDWVTVNNTDEEDIFGCDPARFPSLKRGEAVLISDIIGGDENA